MGKLITEQVRKFREHPDDAELPRLQAALNEHIAQHGFVHISTPISEALYTTLARQLGSIQQRDNIIVDHQMHSIRQHGRRSKMPTVYQDAALGFHTDIASADLLSWYCVKQDEVDGSTLLLDSQQLLSEHFTEAEISCLRRVQSAYLKPTSGGIPAVIYAPLVVQRSERNHLFFFIPWSLAPEANSEQQLAIEKLRECISSPNPDGLIRIRLAEQECLFIDNHRMLHGRGSVPENSGRHLIRYYLGQNND